MHHLFFICTLCPKGQKGHLIISGPLNCQNMLFTGASLSQKGSALFPETEILKKLRFQHMKSLIVSHSAVKLIRLL